MSGKASGAKVVRLEGRRKGASRSTASWTPSQRRAVGKELTLILKRQELRGRRITQDEAVWLVGDLLDRLQVRYTPAQALAAIDEHQYRSPHFPALADLVRIIEEQADGVVAGVDELVFVSQRDRRWRALAARYVRERKPRRGQCPVIYSSEHDDYGWNFPVSWLGEMGEEQGAEHG